MIKTHLINYRITSRRQAKKQQGQAMVEYAILLTLMITLIAGGVEIGFAAFNSNRTAEAAKAGSTEWVKKGLVHAVKPLAPLTYNGAANPDLAFLDVYPGPTGTTDFPETDGAANPNESWGIGDHNSSDTIGGAIDCSPISPLPTTPVAGCGRFTSPVCDPLGHSDGLPLDAAPQDTAKLNSGHADYDVNRQRVYLYNPLPLDISKCPSASGTDFSAFSESLPPVNRAMLSLYVKECVDSSGVTLDCTKADPASTDKVYLRLPGGIHIGSTPIVATPTAMTKLGLFSENTATETFDLDTSKGQESSFGVNTGFIDTFRMHCRLKGVDIDIDGDGILDGDDKFPEWQTEDNCKALCYADATVDNDVDGITVGDGYDDYGPGLACDVRVMIRYRHIFESLVMMMQWKSPVAASDRQYTDSPFDAGGELLRGVLGTEITRGFVLKAQKTFRGCHESIGVINKVVSTAGTPPVTAGGNTVEARACN